MAVSTNPQNEKHFTMLCNSLNHENPELKSPFLQIQKNYEASPELTVKSMIFM